MLKSHDASQEIDALNKCQGHERIVQLEEKMEDDRYTYLVFELLNGGELFSRIRDHNLLTEATAKLYFRQLVEGVQYIHQKNFVHRDLKPENIMFVDRQEDSQLKIIDFGYARRKNSEETLKCFTLDYAAPESLKKGTTNQSRDYWSLGVILYTMLIGHTPFMPENVNKHHDEEKYRLRLKENINKATYNTKCSAWTEISKEAKDLISGLLKHKESERLNLLDVLSHSWLNPSENRPNKTAYNWKEEDVLICIDDESSEDDCVKHDKEMRSKKVWSNDSSGISSTGLVISGNEGSSLSNDEVSEDPIDTAEPIENLESLPSEIQINSQNALLTKQMLKTFDDSTEAQNDSEATVTNSLPLDKSVNNASSPNDSDADDSKEFLGFKDVILFDIGHWEQLMKEQKADDVKSYSPPIQCKLRRDETSNVKNTEGIRKRQNKIIERSRRSRVQPSRCNGKAEPAQQPVIIVTTIEPSEDQMENIGKQEPKINARKRKAAGSVRSSVRVKNRAVPMKPEPIEQKAVIATVIATDEDLPESSETRNPCETKDNKSEPRGEQAVKAITSTSCLPSASRETRARGIRRKADKEIAEVRRPKVYRMTANIKSEHTELSPVRIITEQVTPSAILEAREYLPREPIRKFTFREYREQILRNLNQM